MILPAENENNEGGPEPILGDDVKIHYVHNVDEALDLVPTPAPTSPDARRPAPPQAPTPQAPSGGAGMRVTSPWRRR